VVVTSYFAILTVASFICVLAIIGSSITSGNARNAIVTNIGPYALPLAVVVAIVTTGGSLYLSEVLNYRPCRLCWYQRAAAYPLAAILPIALAIKRPRLHLIALPFAGVGALISTYHLVIERWPSLESSACDPTNPCSLIWVRHFGFVTIPTMALASFLLHLVLVVLSQRALQTPLRKVQS
jgi:disulfide bond formation protein DsbB